MEVLVKSYMMVLLVSINDKLCLRDNVIEPNDWPTFSRNFDEIYNVSFTLIR